MVIGKPSIVFTKNLPEMDNVRKKLGLRSSLKKIKNSNMTPSISIQEARNLIINTQFRESPSDSKCPAERVLKDIEHLGYIQIDTLAVVNRTHHHVLWTRCNKYTKQVLHDLQSLDRAVFEYWGHAMAYLPVSDYRYYLPRMQNFKNPSSPWAKHQLKNCKHLLGPVKKRIEDEGPLSARNFKGDNSRKGSWWDWKPAKIALELLFWQGELMISERQNFQKVYDLTERVLPDYVSTKTPSIDECVRFVIKRGLQAMALATEGELFRFLQPGNSRDSDLQVANRKEFQKQLQNLIDAGDLSIIEVGNNIPGTYYTLKYSSPDLLEPTGVKILSPFDNFIIQRDRIKRFFGFDYALECYLPQPKRKYGYYVMPILWGSCFVGRLDPKADRKQKTLFIKNLVFEPSFEINDNFLASFAEQLRAFALFNDCESIKFERVEPAALLAKLKNLVISGT